MTRILGDRREEVKMPRSILIVPDIVAQGLAPETPRMISGKLNIFAASVEKVWLIDPNVRDRNLERPSLPDSILAGGDVLTSTLSSSRCRSQS